MFEGTYFVNENDEGSLAITINLDDGYDNTASQELSLEVSGVSYLFYARTFGPTIALLIVALIIISFFGARFLKKLTGIQSLKKKEERIVETVKGIQIQYFVEGSMDKKTYDEEMEKWESELEDVRLSIKQLERKAKK